MPTAVSARQVGLSAAEAAEAARVAERLTAELRGLYERLPASARSGVGVARHLGIDRGTGTRFVNVCRKVLPGIEVICQLPGVRGLQQVIEAMEASGHDPKALDAARVAVDQFERLLKRHGSQTRLIEKISSMHREPNDGEMGGRSLIEQRRALFEAAAGALGQWASLRTAVHVYRPTPGSQEKMDQAMLRGLFGYGTRPDAPPYVLQSFGRNDPPPGHAPTGAVAYRTLDGEEIRGLVGGTVMERFSSSPPPLLTARGSGQQSVVTVEPNGENGDSQDLVIAHQMIGEWDLPMYDEPPRHEVSSFIKSPCAALLFDVFLHRSMASRCLASLKVYQSSPGLFHALSDHWYDQLPHPPRLQLLDPDPEALGSRLYPRHAEMLEEFFSRLGWDMRDYVGFRCEVDYPFWAGFYCITFDYEAGRDGS